MELNSEARILRLAVVITRNALGVAVLLHLAAILAGPNFSPEVYPWN